MTKILLAILIAAFCTTANARSLRWHHHHHHYCDCECCDCDDGEPNGGFERYPRASGRS